MTYLAEGELPNEVRWGFYTLEEWSRGAVAHIRALEERIDELGNELEDDRAICWEAGCLQEPVICRDHHELKIALATLRKGDD